MAAQQIPPFQDGCSQGEIEGEVFPLNGEIPKQPTRRDPAVIAPRRLPG
jgi:hypothetical protein